MAIQIPSRETKSYKQSNRSDILGNVVETFGVDFQSDLGTFMATPRMLNITDGVLGVPVAFRFFDGKIWAICGTQIYGNDGTATGVFLTDSSTGAQVDYSPDESDLEIFNGTLCATTTDGLFSKAFGGSGTGEWTQRDTLSSGAAHMQSYFRKFDRLYYINGAFSISSIDTSWSTADPGSDYAITIAGVDLITCLASSQEYIWIGTTYSRGNASIFRWDGISAQPTNEFKLQSFGVMAMTVLNDVPYVIDANGALLQSTGYSFEEIDRLPFYPQNPYNVADIDNERFIHPNGMWVTKNGTIRMLINNRASSGDVAEHLYSGIWEWSEATGLVHVQPLTYTPVGTSSITDYGQTQLERVGAFAILNTTVSTDVNIAGATYYTNASSSTSAIFVQENEDTTQKSAAYTTSWILSPHVSDKWQKIYAKYKKLTDSDDKIVVKYRTSEEDPTYIDITWIDETSFQTSTDLTGKVGQEVTVLRGKGSGKCSHISSVTQNGAIYEVFLDESYTGVSDTAKAVVRNFLKVGSVASSDIKEFKEFQIGKNSMRVQIKVCMQVTGKSKYFETELINEVDKPSS